MTDETPGRNDSQVILYAVIAGVATLVALGAGGLLFSGPPNRLAYFLLLLLCALAAAVVLFGVLKSTAAAKGNVMGLAVELGGPAAVAIIVLLIGARFIPPEPEQTLDFKIRLHGDGVQQADFDGAVVRVDLGQRMDTRYLNRDGEADVVDAPADYKDRALEVALVSPRLEIVTKPEGFHVVDQVVRIEVRKRPEPVAAPVVEAPRIRGIERGERTVLADGFANFDVSGYDFGGRRIVSWGDLSGDITVAMTGGMTFFLPFDAPPFSSADRANAGIALAPDQGLTTLEDCTADLPYQHHWFVPERHKVYCVRRRDGVSFAKLSVEDLTSPIIAFDWIKDRDPKP